MRFIHIADTHLGASPDGGEAYSKVRPGELWKSMERVLMLCEEEKIELLLIAGDLFHRQPLLRELKELNYLFSRFSLTKVVFIAGNHDYLRPDSYYREFPWSANVYPLLNKDMQCLELPDLELAVYGLSYHRREIQEALYHTEKSKIKKQKYEILLAHGGDDKHIPIHWKTLEAVGYDYVALGHIHKPGAMAGSRIMYAGALEPIDKNDTGPHGYILGELCEDEIKTRFIACATREYKHMEVSVHPNMTNGEVKEKVTQLIEQQGLEHLYKVVLIGTRDPDIMFYTSDMNVHGNILEISDSTSPAYDLDKLYQQNEDNLLGQYIQSLRGNPPGSIEYMALYEGVQAILETMLDKRG